MEERGRITVWEYEAEIKDTQWPIVYSPAYNIAFWGLEKLHPFDSRKWGRIFKRLKDAGMLRVDTIVQPQEISEEELLCVHSHEYLNSLKAARLAVERGWAINIGGGFHHCSGERGGGFCVYADITLAVKFAMGHFDKVTNVMIIDLDAHQGNGHERDFMNNAHIYIVDVYNRDIYPNDTYAKGAIRQKVEVRSFIKDSIYLKLINKHIDMAFGEFTPHLVVYNAGTDIIQYDPLGSMSITAKGVMERDRMVFQKCRSRNVPVFMLTSGGYLPESAKVVSDSILNLRKLGLISCEAAEQLNVNMNQDDVAQRVCGRFGQSCLARSSTSIDNPGSTDQPDASIELSTGPA